MIKYVNKFIKLGFGILPVGKNSKQHYKTTEYYGKDPTVDKINKLTLEELKKFPENNYGISAGNNFLIVDIDLKESKPDKKTGNILITKEEAIEKWNKLKEELKETNFLNTLTQQSPTGGLHLFYKLDMESIKITQSTKLDKYIDTRRGTFGYVVGAGSKTEDGVYTIINDVPIIECPKEFREKLLEYGTQNKKEKEKQPINKIKVENKEINIENEKIKKDNKQKKIQKLLNVKCTFNIQQTEFGLKLTPKDGTCLVMDNKMHSTKSHSTIFLNKTGQSNIKCFNCGDKVLDSETNNKLKIIMDLESDEIEIHPTFNYDYFQTLIKYDNSNKFIYTEKQKKYFEQYICAIDYPKRYYVKKNNSSITFLYPKDMFDNFPEFRNFIEKWLKDPKKRRYEKVDFRPDIKKCPENIYNLFNGFEVVNNYKEYDKSKRDEIIKPLLDHFMMLFDNDKKFFDYYIKLYANMFQNPEKKAGIAVIFRGDYGCGKNFTNTDIWGKMVGENLYLSDNKPDTFFNKHSRALENKILINIDEIRGKDTKDVIELLKGWITNSKTTINPKGKDLIEISLFACFVFTTNNMTPIELPVGERRFIAKDLSNDKKNDVPYFAKLSDLLIKDWTMLSAFYDYLMDVQIEPDYKWTDERPITNAYIDIQSAYIPLYIQYIIILLDTFFMKSKYIDDEDIDSDGNVKEKENDELDEKMIKSTELFSKYTKWRIDSNFKDDGMNSNLFGRYMKTIDGITCIKNNTTYYKLNKKQITEFLKKRNYMK